MKKEDVKKWIEDHESEIKTAVKIAVGVGIAIVVGKKIKKSFATMSYTPQVKTITYSPTEASKTVRSLPADLVDLGFEVYNSGDTFLEYADYGDTIPELAIKEMHEAVDAIKQIPGFNPDKTRIQAMFNVYALD